jgi:NAD(P)-dependent dehydrogenase (short-subunit alcohol dehydrogenase family)
MVDYRSMFSLDGRAALVVGAASGIGEAAAHGLAAFGARVIAADVNLNKAEKVAAEIAAQGGQAQAIAMDIRDSASIASALAGLGAVDVLVSTPSINVRKPMLEISDEEFDRVIALNLKGTFMLLKAVARGMVERGRGSIIVFSSIRSEVVEPGQGVYAATKAGMRQMVRALAAEVGPRGVRVNAIAPGVVETPLTAPIKNNPDWYQAYADKSILRRWAQPSEMVGTVLLLASDAGSYMTGGLYFVDGGWTAADGRFTPPL